MQITIDSREKSRIPIAKEYYKKQGHKVNVKELPTGDYLFDDKVVMEFKTTKDFIDSITDGRLWNETQKQMENYNIHFLVLHGTNRDFKEAYDQSGITKEQIIGAKARLNTYTKIIRCTRTIQDTFYEMMITAKKCQDNKTLVRQFGTKSVNPAFNVLAYCIDDIKGERAKNIVNFLNLNTITDVTNLTYDDLLTVPGIGPKLANKIIGAIQ